MNGPARLIDLIQSLSAPMTPRAVDGAERAALEAMAHRTEAAGADEPGKRAALEGIRAVIFDVYGTLLISGTGDIAPAGENRDPETATAGALTAALTEAGFHGDLAAAGAAGPELLAAAIREAYAEALGQETEHPEVEIREIWDTVLEALRGKGLVGGESSEEQRDALAVGYGCRIDPAWPMPGAAETLGALRERGLRLGIVSNAQFYTPLLFKALLGADLATLGFDTRLTVWSWPLRRAKPSVELFETLTAALQREHGIAPGETLFVGNDMLNDIWTAKQAGLKTALFAGDKRSLRMREDDERCRGLKADVVVMGLEELVGIGGEGRGCGSF